MTKVNRDVKKAIKFFNDSKMPTLFHFDPNEPYKTNEFWRCSPKDISIRDDLGNKHNYKACRVLLPKDGEYRNRKMPKTSVCLFSDSIPPHVEGAKHNIPCSYIELDKKENPGSLYSTAVLISKQIYEGIKKEK